MNGFVEKQLSRSKQPFIFDENTCSDSYKEEVILVKLDQDDEQKTRESNKPPI